MALRASTGYAFKAVRSVRLQPLLTRAGEALPPKSCAEYGPAASRIGRLFSTGRDPDSVVRDNIKAAVSKGLKEALGHLKNDGNSVLKLSIIKSGVNAAVKDSLEGHSVFVDYAEHLDLPPEECPEKKPHIVSFVVDGKLCETDIETIFDEKMKAALSGHRDPYVAAVEQMGKNLDIALYRISWKQEALSEKLEARMVAQKILLEDLHSSRPGGNFVDSFLSYLGQKLFSPQVITAGRHLMTMVPYGSRYYFYGLFVYGLLTVEIPLADYALIIAGAHWVAADEIKSKFMRYHTYDKEAAKKAREETAKKVRDEAAKKARDEAAKKGDGQKKV